MEIADVEFMHSAQGYRAGRRIALVGLCDVGGVWRNRRGALSTVASRQNSNKARLADV